MLIPDRSFRDALKFHFASIFLDELDNAGGLFCYEFTLATLWFQIANIQLF